MQVVNIGFGNVVAANRVQMVRDVRSLPSKRLLRRARDEDLLIDATYGRAARGLLITDSHDYILAPFLPRTLAGRMPPDTPFEPVE